MQIKGILLETLIFDRNPEILISLEYILQLEGV